MSPQAGLCAEFTGAIHTGPMPETVLLAECDPRPEVLDALRRWLAAFAVAKFRPSDATWHAAALAKDEALRLAGHRNRCWVIDGALVWPMRRLAGGIPYGFGIAPASLPLTAKPRGTP